MPRIGRDRPPEESTSSAAAAAPGSPSTPSVGSSPIRFREITATSGITFVHCSGNSAEKEFPTCLGSGVALLDYDGDGWLDLYLATTRNLAVRGPRPLARQPVVPQPS